MAKKSVASLQTGTKRLNKAIKMVKKEGSNSYSFDEKIIDHKLAKEWLAGKPIIQPLITNKPSDSDIENKSVTNDRAPEEQPVTDKKPSEEQQVKEEKIDQIKSDQPEATN